MRRAAAMAAILIFAIHTTAAAQLCLGRSLPGEASVALDLAIAPVARLSVGDQTEGGVGWRLGLVGSGSSDSPFGAKGAQGELTFSSSLSESAVVCPGIAYGRTFPAVEDDFGAYALLDLFTSLAAHSLRDDGRTIVGFLTPHLVVGFSERLPVTNLNAPGLLPDAVDPDPDVALALTAGVGLIGEWWTVRFTFTGIRSADVPLLGAGLVLRP